MKHETIFVFGASRSGKSTFAKAVAAKAKINYVSASGFIRNVYPTVGHEPEDIKFLTDRSMEILKDDPLACVKWIRQNMIEGMPNIIEGMRNPNDFMSIVDWRTDKFVNLTMFLVDYATRFEKMGLNAIGECISFNSQMFDRKVWEYYVGDYEEILMAANKFCDEYIK